MELVKQDFEKIKTDWIAQSGLEEKDFLREVSFAMQHISKSPYLQKATRESILKSVINIAQVGLTLNPVSKYAALVPRYNSGLKQVECVLEPMYQGLSKLMTDSGAVTSIQCELIYEGDEVVIDKASTQKVIKHNPYYLTGTPKGKIKAAYSLAILADGSRHFEGMSYDEICEIRDRSESYKSYKEGKIKTCIWVSDEPEMCRKTVFKRHTKWLPKSHELEKVHTAIELDNTLNGYREEAGFELLGVIEGMVKSVPETKRAAYQKRLANLEYKSDAFKLIDELSEYQPLVGIHKTPHTIAEQSEAIRNAADLDDFKERK